MLSEIFSAANEHPIIKNNIERKKIPDNIFFEENINIAPSMVQANYLSNHQLHFQKRNNQ